MSRNRIQVSRIAWINLGVIAALSLTEMSVDYSSGFDHSTGGYSDIRAGLFDPNTVANGAERYDVNRSR